MTSDQLPPADDQNPGGGHPDEGPDADPGWGHIWPPPPPDAGVWSGNVPGWGPPSATAAAPPRKHHGLPVAVAAGLVAAAVAAGVGIGHTVWTSPTVKASAAATSPSTSPSTTPSGSGLGQGANPYGGQNPYGYQSPFSNGGASSGNGSSGSTSTGSGGPSDVSSIAGKIDPALVDINVQFNYQSSAGAGTGIVLTSNGEILTNNHVINGATSISVTDIGNGKTYRATVVGYDPVHDLAVLQLQNASGLQTASLADSSKVAVGDQVVAVGNAGGTGGTPTANGGAVTALNQNITASDELNGTNEQLTNLIQVNADVQSGDSGGALVNTAGQVIGMNTASNSNYSLTSSTQGFAIPINEAIATANAIENGQGSATIHVGATGFLGVLLNSASSGQLGSSSGQGGQGVQVASVVSGGPAAAAGLTQGDTITSFDGQTVTSLSTISTAMITHHPGDRVEIGWVDSSGQSHTATMTLASGPAS